MPPHSLVMTMIGAALLWVGWFGFNVGSNLEVNQFAGVPFINTFIATCAAGLSWMLVEWIAKGKPSALGLASGVVAGLVAITPACGFAGVMGSIVLGLVVSPVCFFFCSAVKNALGYDDSLGRLRCPLHRRHHRRHRHRPSRQPGLGWRGHSPTTSRSRAS